jgi:hypothetical protein
MFVFTLICTDRTQICLVFRCFWYLDRAFILYPFFQEKHKPAEASKIVEKQKEKLESVRSESRFKVVGGRRNLDVDELNDDNLFHLLDIFQEDWSAEPKAASIGEVTPVDKISCNGVELDIEKSKDFTEFVYDVYFHHRHHSNKTGEIEICTPESIDQVGCSELRIAGLQIKKSSNQIHDQIYRLIWLLDLNVDPIFCTSPKIARSLL